MTAGAAAALLAVALCLTAWRIDRFGHQARPGSADAAIVLGAAAWGGRPSPVYRERIAEAISLYKAHHVRKIILTGGSAHAGFPSEAMVGRRFCIANGVPAEVTLIDETSRTTWQNLQHGKALMESAGAHTALLVSDPWHLRRAVTMARDMGINASPAPTRSSRFRSWPMRAGFLWRETWLYLAYCLFGIRR
jgi:uncharacterized SAM-binding protein YcdF (DUF218 family)